jgi:hypothetical protein
MSPGVIITKWEGRGGRGVRLAVSAPVLQGAPPAHAERDERPRYNVVHPSDGGHTGTYVWDRSPPGRSSRNSGRLAARGGGTTAGGSSHATHDGGCVSSV